MKCDGPGPAKSLLLTVIALALLALAGAGLPGAHAATPASAISDRLGGTQGAVGPIRADAPPAAGHYYAGGQYNGYQHEPTSVQVKLTTPSALPTSGEFYYVLMSIWDSNGSYDQIGFASDGTDWGFTYSWTAPCASIYYFNDNFVALKPGVTYTFRMTILAGILTFYAYDGPVLVTSLTAPTGGDYFVEHGFYFCNNLAYYDYTDYEEIYDVTQTVPSESFFFQANKQNATPVRNWISFDIGAPGGYEVECHLDNVTIANQGFSLQFATGVQSATLAPGAKTTATIVVQELFADGNVTLAVASVSHVKATLSVTYGPPTFDTKLTIHAGAKAAAGTYEIVVTATDSSSNYTYVDFTITVT